MIDSFYFYGHLSNVQILIWSYEGLFWLIYLLDGYGYHERSSRFRIHMSYFLETLIIIIFYQKALLPHFGALTSYQIIIVQGNINNVSLDRYCSHH